MKKSIFVILLFITFSASCQKQMKWPEGKKAAIVLTYDDALASHLNVAIPQLDQANLKGTFFLNEPKTQQHIDQWRAASKKGHELGNHSLYHPCLSSMFPADQRYHAEKYSVANIIREIGAMNKMLYAIDNKSTRTYAYPCGETLAGGKDYVDSLRRSGLIKYARSGGNPIITDFINLDPLRVPCMGYAPNPPASAIIDFVKQVQQSKGMGVFIFHGVGGDYQQVSAEAHQQLVKYLKDNSKDIWVATFEEAMDYVSKQR